MMPPPLLTPPVCFSDWMRHVVGIEWISPLLTHHPDSLGAHTYIFPHACCNHTVTHHLRPCQYQFHLCAGANICFLTTLFFFTVSRLIISTAPERLAWQFITLEVRLWRTCRGKGIETSQTRRCNCGCVSSQIQQLRLKWLQFKMQICSAAAFFCPLHTVSTSTGYYKPCYLPTLITLTHFFLCLFQPACLPRYLCQLQCSQRLEKVNTCFRAGACRQKTTVIIPQIVFRMGPSVRSILTNRQRSTVTLGP